MNPTTNTIDLNGAPAPVAQPIATIGRTVLYTLTPADVDAIHRRRTTGAEIAKRIVLGEWPLGAQAHIGNSVYAGQIVPMIVVAVWPNNLVNGQALLDGTDNLWVTSASQSESAENGKWHWPPRI